MKNLKLILVASIAAFVISCSKDDDSVFILPTEHANLLTKSVDSDNNLTRLYQYDGNFKCTGYQSGTNPAAMDSYTFHYNSNGTLDEVTDDNDGDASYRKYFYDTQGRIIKILGREGIDVHLYTYEGNTITDNYRFTLTNVGFIEKWTFNSNGNATEVMTYSNASDANPEGTYSGRIRYTYDDKKSSRTSLPKQYYFPNSPVNNLLTMQFDDNPASAPIVYEYNADGYPTKFTESYTRVFTYQRL